MRGIGGTTTTIYIPYTSLPPNNQTKFEEGEIYKGLDPREACQNNEEVLFMWKEEKSIDTTPLFLSYKTQVVDSLPIEMIENANLLVELKMGYIGHKLLPLLSGSRA